MFTRTVSLLAISSALACSAPFATAVAQGSDAAPSAPIDAPDSALGRLPLPDSGAPDSDASSAVDAAPSTDTSVLDSGATPDAATDDASNTFPPDSGHSTSAYTYDVAPGSTFLTYYYSQPATCIIVASGCDTPQGLTLDREYRPIVGSAGGKLQCAVTNHTSVILTLTMWITCQQ